MHEISRNYDSMSAVGAFFIIIALRRLKSEQTLTFSRPLVSQFGEFIAKKKYLEKQCSVTFIVWIFDVW